MDNTEQLFDDTLIINLKVCVHLHSKWIILDGDGAVQTVSADKARIFLSDSTSPVLVCHKNDILLKLGLSHFMAVDILELWSFVRPGKFVIPTASGVVKSLKIEISSDEDLANSLLKSSGILLNFIKQEAGRPYVEDLIASMGKTGWGWAKPLLKVLGLDMKSFISKHPSAGLDIWNRRPKWQDRPPPSKPNTLPIDKKEVISRLNTFLSSGSEHRIEQANFSNSLIDAFQPKNEDDACNVILAEGGTGVGKTLGYLAPATVWAEKNDAPVWISTYTRNLQHQIYEEVKSLYPDDKQRYEKIVICKGRENYVCLTRFQVLTRRAKNESGWTVSLGILARWMEVSTDGDLKGQDFPSWLSDVIDPTGKIISGLVIRRDFGESHAYCDYTDACFVDLPLKRAPYADIVIANHAFLLHRCKVGWMIENQISHIIFDEGHHLFDASDAAFTNSMSAQEGQFMRRFIIKNDSGDMLGGKGSGLSFLVDDCLAGNLKAKQQLEILLECAVSLPDDHWNARLGVANPTGEGEEFLNALARFIYENTNNSLPYDLELTTDFVPENIQELAKKWADVLVKMISPAKQLMLMCDEKVKNEGGDLDAGERRKLNYALRTLEFRVVNTVTVWADMLYGLSADAEESGASNYNKKINSDAIIDRLFIKREGGRDKDVGMMRHLVDPMKLFAMEVLSSVRGAVITSATLTDKTVDIEQNWKWAELRTGIRHLNQGSSRTQVQNPFDYKNHSKVIIINDVDKKNISDVAGAYKALFEASNGGALGVFTSISRLKSVGKIIGPALGERGIDVYAQHMDTMNVPTLIDIFKQDKNSCLLGTDAVRDGVDVPGESLRLLVLERIPWVVPDIVHKKRRSVFKGTDYDKALTRAKLKQAFGRLIRRKDDKGIFIILEPTPSNLKTSFPDDTEVITCGLKDAIMQINKFI